MMANYGAQVQDQKKAIPGNRQGIEVPEPPEKRGQIGSNYDCLQSRCTLQ